MGEGCACGGCIGGGRAWGCVYIEWVFGVVVVLFNWVC